MCNTMQMYTTFALHLIKIMLLIISPGSRFPSHSLTVAQISASILSNPESCMLHVSTVTSHCDQQHVFCTYIT